MTSDLKTEAVAAASPNGPPPPSSAQATEAQDAGWTGDVKVLGLILLLATGATLLALRILIVEHLSDSEWAALRLPTSLEAAQELGKTLNSVAAKEHTRVLVAHMCCYLYLQTFAIPGTVFFNLLGGALFGMTLGFPLCLAYNTLGSVFMYMLSKYCGRRAVLHLFPRKLATLRELVDRERDDLALYMVFLRVFPFTPNWFINLASPHLEIPLTQFVLGPLLGLIPYNFFSCKAGLILSKLQSKGDIIDTTTTIQLVVIAVLGGILLPRLKKRFAGATPQVKQD